MPIKGLLGILLTVLSIQSQAFEPPSFEPNVVDHAQVLSAQEKQSLNDAIQEIRKEADVWAAVYLLKDLAGVSIEEAAEKTFRKWQLGEKGKDNGILLIFAIDNRRARIEVGYGLEGSITDIHAKRLLDDVILPDFKNAHYAKGLMSGLYSVGYLVSKKESLLARSGQTLEGINAMGKEFSGLNPDFDPVKGFRYWLVWVLIVVGLPFFDRIIRLINNKYPKKFSFQAPTTKDKFLYLIGVKHGSIFLTLFLLVNPGIFIFLSPVFIDDIPFTAEIYSNMLFILKIWVLFFLLVPPLLKTAAFFVGMRKLSRNPVYHLRGLRLFLFFVDFEGSLIKKIISPIFYTLMSLMLSSFLSGGFPTKSLVPTFVFMTLYLYFFWHYRMRPILFERVYRRMMAQERLRQIKTRVYGTRQIFGKTYTYSRSSSSSSSSRSSSSSSSGGGRSGGGGASSSW